jgi:alkylation response protein AidB-like acyl-CoA dehydrogenase
MLWERSCILAGNLGVMKRQVEACTRYANERIQYGHPIAAYPAVTDKIIAMQMRLEAARLLLYRIACENQAGAGATLTAAMAKYYVGEAWVQTCLDAIQIHGGYGITVDYEFERELRDALCGRIYSGTSEIQKNLISRSLGL